MLQPNDISAIVPFAFTADGAYPAHTRMKMSGTFGVLTAAGDEAHLGTLARRTKASGDPATLISKHASGAQVFLAGGAIAAGAQTTSAAAGKVVTGVGGAVDYGIALTAASGDLDTVMVLPS